MCSFECSRCNRAGRTRNAVSWKLGQRVFGLDRETLEREKSTPAHVMSAKGRKREKKRYVVEQPGWFGRGTEVNEKEKEELIE